MGLSWAGKGQGVIPCHRRRMAPDSPFKPRRPRGPARAESAFDRPSRAAVSWPGQRPPYKEPTPLIRMTTWVAAVLVVLIVAVATVVCVHLWTTNLRYEIVGDGRAVHVLDRKTGTIQWIVGGEVRNSTGPYLIR